MGEVWLARHEDLAIPVIFKTLLPGVGETFEVRYQRLLQEARLMARLTSPRIVRVVDAGVYTPPDPDSESLPYLVEEYVDGIDLAELERRRREVFRRPLPLWLVTGVLAQAAEGLDSAHQGGVIHCDVKPSNLFGHGHARIKVGDFGVAVASASAEGAPPAGTPGFMAPEQWLAERVERRADVYALGATGFALRYGRTPFASPTEGLKLDALPMFPPPSTPEEAYFQHVLGRMLARRADARYASMSTPWHLFEQLSAATRPKLRQVRLSANEFELERVRITFEVGDLTTIETDAIVNSATTDLSMRSSLADAIRCAGGDQIEEEALALGPRALGECVLTSAGTLKAKAILHAVGGWHEVSCIARATHRALWLAEEKKFARIALPAIATGAQKVPVEAAADSMLSALRIHIAMGGSQLRELRFVLPTQEKLRRFVDVAAGVIMGGGDAHSYDDAHDAPVDLHESANARTLFASAVNSSPSPVRQELWQQQTESGVELVASVTDDVQRLATQAAEQKNNKPE
jgi:serine/threonine-protein kinase